MKNASCTDRAKRKKPQEFYYVRERKIIQAAEKWAEFMELRRDKFKWSQPERVLYEVAASVEAKAKA